MKIQIVQVTHETPKLQKVSIKDGTASDFVFYTTEGKDIMLLTNRCVSSRPWGFKSVFCILAKEARNTEKCNNPNRTFRAPTRECAMSKVIKAGRTLYGAHYMDEVFDIYTSELLEKV